MGYYTKFSLHVLDPLTLEPVEHVPATLRGRVTEAFNEAARATRRTEITAARSSHRTSILPLEEHGYWGPSGFDWTSDSYGAVNHGDTVKWYDHEEHLKLASNNVLGYVLCLRGEGEESGDVWTAYAYRGRSYKVKQKPWVPPPPDPTIIGPFSAPDPEPTPPPTPRQALEAVLRAGVHDQVCPVSVGGPRASCACYLVDAQRALEGLARG